MFLRFKHRVKELFVFWSELNSIFYILVQLVDGFVGVGWVGGGWVGGWVGSFLLI